MTDPQEKAVGGLTGLRRRSLEPERLPEFPPRPAAELAAAAARMRGARRRRRLLGLGLAVVIAAAGAGVVVGLDPLSPEKPEGAAPEGAAKVIASAEPGSVLSPAAVQADAAAGDTHTGALALPPPAPVLPPPPPMPATAAAPTPATAPSPAATAPAPEVAAPPTITVAEPAPAPAKTVTASLEPPAVREPLAASTEPASSPTEAQKEPVSTPKEPASAPQAAPAAQAPATVLKPAELNSLIAKGEQFLQSGDLASARLFFRRAANAGDPRGARGLARSYDPEVVRKLPVYGLPVDKAEADTWYARARELESGKALAQQ